MSDFEIRHPEPADHKDLLQILYDTGYYGETLKGHRIFEDKALWGYMWLDYYLNYQRDNCFVAYDQKQKKVAGYIIGVCDSQAYQYDFVKNMVPKIQRRMKWITSWRHPSTYKTARKFTHFFDLKQFDQDSWEVKYPGHLHMNVAAGYQGHGLGSQLITRFEERMKEQGVTGVHLGTTARNQKAVPFYKKHGYKVVFTGTSRWMGILEPETDYYRMVKDL